MCVVFRLMKYLVREIKLNNTKNFMKKTSKINGVAYFNLGLSNKIYQNDQVLLLYIPKNWLH